MKKKIIKISIIVVVIIIFLLLILSLALPKLSFDKAINSFIFGLNIKDTEKYNFDLSISTDGNDKYNVLNNATLKGSYISTNNDYKLKADFTSNYNETVNMYLYNNGTTSYYYDEFLSNNVLSKDTGKLNLSLNNLKLNVKNILVSLKNSGIDKYLSNKIIKGQNIITLKIDNDNIDNIISYLSNTKLDNPYQYLLTNLINDMNNNKDNYIGTEINLYTSLISGNFIKLEIKNSTLITLTKDNGYYLEIIGKDNKVYKLNVNKNNVSYTESKGSNNILNVNVAITYDTNAKIDNVDISNATNIDNMTDEGIFNIYKNISSNKTKNDALNLYYYLINSQNVINMNVTDGNYYVYYVIPSGYTNTYIGSSTKKYINYDKSISYSINNYNQNQMLSYIADEYDKATSTGYYKKTSKNPLSTISYNNNTYYYETITKAYTTNYADYDDTNSTLYLWKQLDDNTCFVIQYEFQGSSITNDTITSLLNIRIGK